MLFGLASMTGDLTIFYVVVFAGIYAVVLGRATTKEEGSPR